MERDFVINDLAEWLLTNGVPWGDLVFFLLRPGFLQRDRLLPDQLRAAIELYEAMRMPEGG